MYSSVRIVFLFLLLSSAEVLSQNYLPLFSDYIPQSILKDKDFREQVDLNIDHYASVNPDLVYYYIMYIDKRFGEKITDADSNYYNLLREKDYEYRYARNTWVQSEIKSADEISPNTLSSAVKRYLSELYQNDLREYKSNGELTVDKGMQAYFTFMIVRGKKSQYNEDFNYLSVIKKELENKRKYFEEAYSDASELGQSKRMEMIQSSLSFPYLFRNGYLEKYSQTTDLRLNEFIREMLSEEFVRKNSIRAGIFYFKTDFKNTNIMNFTEDPFPYFHLESEDEVKMGTGVFLDLGFMLGLRNYKTPFSYLEVDVGYGFLTDFKAKNNTDPFIIQKDSWQPGTGTHSIITYTLTANNESSHYELYGRISTPVYYFNRNIFVDVGLNYFYTSVKRNVYDLTRQIDSIVSANPNDFQEYQMNYSYEFSKGNFYPSIGFNYSMFEFLNFKAEYMIPLMLIAKMEVVFHL